MALAQVSNQLLRSQGNSDTTVAANYPITGDGSTQLPLGLAEDYRGADGVSVTFEVSSIPSGHRVTLSGAQGTESFDVMNGETGPSGAQGETGPQGPEGPQGPSGSQGPAGRDGVDGVSPTFRFSETEDGVTVYVSGAQGESSFSLYNGTDAPEYSAGPNINITNDIISGKDWTDDISAACQDVMQMIPDYSAGPNIDITNDTISGRDWTPDIESAISSVSGDYYPMTGNPSGFLTAVDLSNYYKKNETSSKEEISAAIDAIPRVVDYSAGANINITNHVVSGKDWTNTITAASSYAYNQATADAQGHTYTGVAPIVVNNAEDKISADCIELSAGKGVDSNKLAIGVIEVSAESIEYSAGSGIDSTKLAQGVIEVSAVMPTPAGGGLTVCAYSAVTSDLNTFYDSVKDNPQDCVIKFPYNNNSSKIAYLYTSGKSSEQDLMIPDLTIYYDCLSYRCDDNLETSALNVTHSYKEYHGTIFNETVNGSIDISAVGQGGGGAAISGQYNLNGDTITADCSAFGMYEQANSVGSYQLMATANNASWHSYGYTMSTPENVLMSNVSSVAQNYAASAVSSHIRLMNYPDIKFSAVRDTFNAGGIVVPYETTQGYSTFYNFVGSSVADSTSSYKFDYIGTNGYATTLTVSSYNNGATTGVYREYKHIFLAPSACECKVVVVATSGDIPASGATDGKLYVVTGT